MSLLPLEGFVVGITADRRWAEQAELLTRRGASVVHGPTLSTRYLGSDDALRAATETVIARPPDYLVATTGIGVRAWFEAAQTWGRVDELLGALRETTIMPRGPKAAAALAVAGLGRVENRPGERLDDVLDILADRPLDGRVVAYQHYGRPDPAATGRLSARGAAVVDIPVYRYGPPEDEGPAQALVEAVCDRQVDAVTFTSAPAVTRLVDMAEGDGRRSDLLEAFNSGAVVAACVGAVCAEAAGGAGIQRPLAPAKGRLGLLVRSLTDALQQRRQELRCGSSSVVVQGRVVAVDGEAVSLTPGERALLESLLRRPGVVVPKAALLRSGGAAPCSDRALESAVARLRRRLGPAGDALRVVRGRGYCIDAVPVTRPA